MTRLILSILYSRKCKNVVQIKLNKNNSYNIRSFAYFSELCPIIKLIFFDTICNAAKYFKIHERLVYVIYI